MRRTDEPQADLTRSVILTAVVTLSGIALLALF